MSKPLFAAGDLSGLPEQGLAVVGFSGGADSTALAHWLAGKIDPRRIVLAHVNHMLRGEEAERDEAAARAFARKQGLRLVVSREDVKALAAQGGMGLEECGRAVRYRFFQSLLAGEDDRIFTAHTADDNAETMLLNLCRGTGLAGLCGIPEKRGNILRPLLRVTRQEIEEYCALHNLSYVTDSSNLSGEFARNRIRLEVLPVLKELNPRLIYSMSQTAGLLEQDRRFLSAEGEKLLADAMGEYGLSAAVLRNAPRALQTEALRLWLKRLGCGEPEKKHLEAALCCLTEGGAAMLPGDLVVRCAQGVLSAAKREAAQPFSIPVSLKELGQRELLKIPLPDGRTLVFEKKVVEREENSERREQKIHNLLFKNALDYDIIATNLVVRTRREGDKFAPAGRKVTKSLKQVFQECGMPASRRGSAALLEIGGTLAFCEGAGAAQGFEVTEATRTVLTVTVQQKRE